MLDFIPLHCHSTYSLLDGLPKPSRMAERCADIGASACALTDHGSVSGSVQFIKEMNKVGIKPILGCEFYINKDNPEISKRPKNDHLVVLSKSEMGWRDLVSLVSLANSKDHFKGKPRLKLGEFEDFSNGNLIAFSGHIGSELSTCLFDEGKDVFKAKNEKEVRECLHPDYMKRAIALAEYYQKIFGKGNFFIEIQLIDRKCQPSAEIIASILREVSVKTGIPKVATPDAHYAYREDAADQRILLCTSLNMTLGSVQERLSSGQDVPLGAFFRSSNYFIPNSSQMQSLHEGYYDEVKNTKLISDMCDDYTLESKPRLPKFPCPEGLSSDEYLKSLCREGWRTRRDKFMRLKGYREQEYVDRLSKEFSVLSGAGLSDYFLIVHDIINAAKKRGELVGPGRGSAAGSLVLYLLGVTEVNPIEYGLIFERFYNEGRNTKDRVSLPDVDMDFERIGRQANFTYCKEKYGERNVAQVMTFNTMQGATTVKDVFRAHGALGFDEVNRMTKHFPKKEDISDQLQDMENPSIIRWVLENTPQLVEDWVRLDDNGTVTGRYAKIFEQAMRIEGSKKSLGKHPAGIIISQQPLDTICPIVNVKGDLVAGMEMNDAESCGHLKLDALTTAVLDKLHMCQNQLLTGEMGYDD